MQIFTFAFWLLKNVQSNKITKQSVSKQINSDVVSSESYTFTIT